eukprot:scaffold69549_cov51-Phaeocystis_antarctica.AAC.1
MSHVARESSTKNDEKYTGTRVAKNAHQRSRSSRPGHASRDVPLRARAPLSPRPRELFSESLDTTFTTLSPLTPHTHIQCVRPILS